MLLARELIRLTRRPERDPPLYTIVGRMLDTVPGKRIIILIVIIKIRERCVAFCVRSLALLSSGLRRRFTERLLYFRIQCKIAPVWLAAAQRSP
jgi:hypothetical protein